MADVNATQTIGFSYWVGLWKFIKNAVVMLALPALVFLVDNWSHWVPVSWIASPIAIALFGAIGYWANNIYQNHPALQ